MSEICDNHICVLRGKTIDDHDREIRQLLASQEFHTKKIAELEEKASELPVFRQIADGNAAILRRAVELIDEYANHLGPMEGTFSESQRWDTEKILALHPLAEKLISEVRGA